MYINFAIQYECPVCNGNGGHKDYDDWFTCYDCDNGDVTETITGLNNISIDEAKNILLSIKRKREIDFDPQI